MDDLQTLERRVAREVIRGMGPSQPVDDAAIFAAISTTRSHKWRFRAMFGATRFVAAAAIVALFGGFAIMGIVSIRQADQPAPGAESPSPTTTESLLSGMVTQEVEPGVFKILDDGAGHDLVKEPPAGLTVAPNGSVWLLRMKEWSDQVWSIPADAVFELGREGTVPFSSGMDARAEDLAIGADGVAWLNHKARAEGGVLATLDGSTWSHSTWPDGATGVGTIEAAPDGAVWLIEESFDPSSRVARIVDGEWTVLPPLDDPSLAGFFDGDGPGYVSRSGFRRGYLAADADGTAWLASGGHQGPSLRNRIASPDGLLHFDGTRWEVVALPPGGSGVITRDGPTRTIEGWLAGPLALGADGTLWVYLEQPGTRAIEKINDPQAGHLARLDADGWSLFSATGDGVPKLVTYGGGYEAEMVVDGDGTVWVAPDHRGVWAFDGGAWRRYLGTRHTNVGRLGVSPDGYVFATALSDCLEYVTDAPTPWCSSVDPGGAGLYVITPEAIAAGG